MRKLWAIIINELKLLWRDRAGLLVLFAMPAALVLVITLVQENVMKTVGESTIDVLVVDKDGQAVGQEIEDRLRDCRKSISSACIGLVFATYNVFSFTSLMK